MRDWTEIEKRYVEGDVSLRALAQQEGISPSTLKKRAWTQHWSEKRRSRREQAARAEPEETNGRELDKLKRATEKLTDAALRALEDDAQFCRWLVADGGGQAKTTEERVFQKIDTKSLKELAAVLKELTELTRGFYGVPAPEELFAERLAEEKLLLDRQKLELAVREAALRREEDAPEEIRVVLEKDMEALSE